MHRRDLDLEHLPVKFNVNSFRIFRSGTRIATVPSNTTSYVDLNAVPGQENASIVWLSRVIAAPATRRCRLVRNDPGTRVQAALAPADTSVQVTAFDDSMRRGVGALARADQCGFH